MANFQMLIILARLVCVLAIRESVEDEAGVFEEEGVDEFADMYETFDSTGRDGTSESFCSQCDKDLSFDATFGVEWVVFPPNPFFNPITTFICTPHPISDRWNLPPSNIGTMCDKELESQGAIDEDTTRQLRRECEERLERMPKTSSGTMANTGSAIYAWAKQAWRCGTCALCKILKKTGQMLAGLKAGIALAFRYMRQNLIGHAKSSEIEDMKAKFQTMLERSKASFVANPGAGSLVERGRHNSSSQVNYFSRAEREKAEGQGIHAAYFADGLVTYWKSLDPEARAAHMRKIANEIRNGSLVEFEKSHKKQVANQISEHVGKATGKLAVWDTPECQKAIKANSVSSTLEVSVNIEFPVLVNSIWKIFSEGIMGALKSCIPEVLVMAIPKKATALKSELMEDCLKLIEQDQDDFLEKCHEERPLLACVARTSQKMLDRFTYEEWWPSFEKNSNADNTVRANALSALQTVSEGSCLENKIINQEEQDSKLVATADSSRYFKFQQFEQVQCPYIRGRIDSKDGTGRDPGITDRLWTAALRALAGEVQKEPLANHRCPDVLPIATAFCANELRCFYDDFDASANRDVPDWAQFNNAMEQRVAAFDSDGNGVLDDLEAAAAFDQEKVTMESEASRAYATPWSTNTSLKMWSFLWSSVNMTFYDRWSWKPMKIAIKGGRQHLDWGAASQNWRFVYNYLHEMLRFREASYSRLQDDETLSLSGVLSRIDGIYASNLCSPTKDGANLAEISSVKLRMLEASSQAVTAHEQVYTKARQTQVAMETGWIRLRAKVSARRGGVFGRMFQTVSSTPQIVRDFKKALDGSLCHCACVHTQPKKEKFSDNLNCSIAPPPKEDAFEGMIMNGHIEVSQTKFYSAKLGAWTRVGPADLMVYEAPGGGHGLKGCRTFGWKSKERPSRADSNYEQWKTGRAFISSCAPPDGIMTHSINKKAMTFDLDLYLYRTPSQCATWPCEDA